MAKNVSEGPAVDHTTGKDDGWFARATFPATRKRVKQGPAVLRTSAKGPLCFTAWLHISALRLPLVQFTSTAHTQSWFWGTSSETRTFLRGRMSEVGLWQKVVYYDNRQNDLEIELQSSFTDGTVAVDDLSVTPGKCPEPSQEGSCTFENSGCGYTNDPGNGHVWKRRLPWAESWNNVVDDDHTTQTENGGYAFYKIDTWDKSSGVLTSAVLSKPENPNQCLRFFYFVPYAVPSRGLLVQIIRNLKPGSRVLSQLNLTAGEKLSCGFDEGHLCKWQTSSGPGDATWLLSDVENGRPVLPRLDHSLGTSQGKFIYVENEAKNSTIKATLLSPPLDPDWVGAACLSFWHFRGSGAYQQLQSDRIVSQRKRMVVGFTAAETFLEPRSHPDLATRRQRASFNPGLTRNCFDRFGRYHSVLRPVSFRTGGPELRFRAWALHMDKRRSYAFLSGARPSTPLSATLASDYVNLAVPGVQCMDFWFIVRDVAGTKLRVFIEAENFRKVRHEVVWVVNPSNSSDWRRGQLKIPRMGRVIFEGEVANTKESYIAIDDISIDINSNCRTIPQSAIAGQQGFCLLLSSSLTRPIRASLESPLWSSSNGPRLLEFWYIVETPRSATLSVELQSLLSSTIATIWRLPTTAPPLTWNLARIAISPQEVDFKVVVKGSALRVSSFNSLLALADIRLNTHPSSHVANCNFEDDLCGYSSASGSDPGFRWFVGSGRVRKPLFKPPVLQLPLVGLSEGLQASKTFAYVDTTVPLQGSETSCNATMSSPVFRAGQNDTLLIRYFRNGNSTESFMVYQSVWNTGDQTIKRVPLGSLVEGDDWQDFEAPLAAAAESRIHIVITRSRNQTGFAAVASISVGHPRAGHYIYVARNMSSDVASAQLKGPIVPKDALKSMCFSFWYFLLVDSNSSLSVSLSSSSNVAWRSSVSRVVVWTHGQAQFAQLTPEEGTQIILEARVQRGLVAVDDLTATPGPCPATSLCSFEGGVDCALEPDLNNAREWTVVNGSSLDLRDHSTDSTEDNVTRRWSLQRAGVPPITRDHTLNSDEGHYLLFKEDDPGQRAALVLTDQRYRCATLWHYISEEPDNLTVTAGGIRLTTSTRGQWNLTVFPVDPIKTEISAISGSRPGAFAAIDDLKLLKYPCNIEPIPVTPPFVCAESAKEIPSQARCNFIADCSDGSDERDCGSCSFEKSTCGWSVDGPNLLRHDDFSWKRQSAAADLGPMRDHSTNSRRGEYMNGGIILRV
ncbi:hypothetical protein MTO96_009697 [Rhipicephalus appendiculatus]